MVTKKKSLAAPDTSRPVDGFQNFAGKSTDQLLGATYIGPQKDGLVIDQDSNPLIHRKTPPHEIMKPWPVRFWVASRMDFLESQTQALGLGLLVLEMF